MKKKIFLSLLVLSLVFIPSLSLAQGGGGSGGGGGPVNVPISIRISNPFNCGGAQTCTLMDLILAIFNNIILPIAAVGVTLWIVWSGFMFIQAQGNSKAIDDAKRNLLWSLIGAGVLLGAAGIAAVVKSTIQALITP